MADIFVSYTREDAERAAQVVAALKQRGWSVFWDRTIPASKQWDDVLKRQLDRSRCVIVLWSTASLASEWVLHEASVARHRKVLVPALLEASLASDRRISSVFRSIQSVRLVGLGSEGDTGLADLVQAVQRVIGRPRKRLWWALGAVALGLLVWKGNDLAQAAGQLRDDVARAWRNLEVMQRSGVKWVNWGAFTPEENERDFRLVREARTVDLLVTNANSFTAAFRNDLRRFFERPEAKMRVIFASAETPFYFEMMQMTGRVWKDDEAYRSDVGLVARSKQELLNTTTRPEQIEFRYFNTQYRMPVIVIDGRYCLLTVRLPPDEGLESLRLEADDVGVPVTMRRAASGVEPKPLPHVAKSCQSHFEKMWEQASQTPVRTR